MDDLESNFNLKIVLVSFKQCLNEKQEVLLDHYLAGWRGLVRYIWGGTALWSLPQRWVLPQRWGFPGHTSCVLYYGQCIPGSHVLGLVSCSLSPLAWQHRALLSPSKSGCVYQEVGGNLPHTLC